MHLSDNEMQKQHNKPQLIILPIIHNRFCIGYGLFYARTPAALFGMGNHGFSYTEYNKLNNVKLPPNQPIRKIWADEEQAEDWVRQNGFSLLSSNCYKHQLCELVGVLTNKTRSIA